MRRTDLPLIWSLGLGLCCAVAAPLAGERAGAAPSGAAVDLAAELFADPSVEVVDACTLRGAEDFRHGYEARNADDTINVVIEIPAGTTPKWEVDQADGLLRCDIETGAPRVVRYLAYPANYGMIPRTLSGDGDPLDVIVLGHLERRGRVIAARLVGLLELWDDGERDFKLIAVPARPQRESAHLAAIRDLEDLDERLPGARSILETWLSLYKGRGRSEARGFGDQAAARRELEAAIDDYRKASSTP